jgi:hypothetical protein
MISFIANAKTFVRLRGLTPSPRTRSGVQNLDSCFRRNDEQDGRHGGSSGSLASNGQGDIMLGNRFRFLCPLELHPIHSGDLPEEW